MVRTHEEVSLNTSESDTGVSRLVKANERRIGEVNRLPLPIKKPPFEVVFLLAIGKVMVRTHEKVSLNTSESDTGVSRLAKANERRIGEANRLPMGNKKATSW